MKKILKQVIAILSIVMLTPFLFAASIVNNNENTRLQTRDLQTRGIDPTFPDLTFGNTADVESYMNNWSGWNDVWYDVETRFDLGYFNSNYLSFYKGLKADWNMWYWHYVYDWWGSGTIEESNWKNQTKEISIGRDWVEVNKEKSPGIKSESQMLVKANIENNRLILYIKSKSKAWWNGGSTANHKTKTISNASNIKLLSKNEWPAQNDKFISSMQKTFNFTSSTSQWLNSEYVFDIWNNKQIKSNKDVITDEIKKRTKENLKDYNIWNEYIDLENPTITIDKGTHQQNKTTGSANIKFKPRKVNSTIEDKFQKNYNMPLLLNFDRLAIEDKINKIFADTPFELVTNTSTIMDEWQIKDEQDGSPNKGLSNKEVIEKEIDKRFQNFNNSHPAIKDKIRLTSKQFINKENKVEIKFTDNDEFTGQGQWVEKTEMQVKIKPTSIALNRSFLERIKIFPGKMVNPNDPSGAPIEDEPELVWDGETPTFIYHNSVDFLFESSKGSGEMVKINGEPIEVYNNIFSKKLLDNRLGPDPDKKEIPYAIEITGKDPDGKERKININILIHSLNSRTTFKWQAWDPIDDANQPEKYKQWLLTQPKLPNEEGDMVKNPLYDPTIDAATGVRIEQIWVKKDKKYIDNNPFPLDPFDKKGNKIDPKNPPKDRDFGYFAEAYVINSGLLNLLDEGTFNKTYDKVERLQIMDDNGNKTPDAKPEIVDFKNEGQFSTPGLYEYFFHVKDRAPLYTNSGGKKLNPADVTTYPPTGKNIEAVGGNILHKFLYLSNKVDAYKTPFTSLPFIEQDPNIYKFDEISSISAYRLKWYLINEYKFTTAQLNKLNYENNFGFWKQYVSEGVMDKIESPGGHNVLNLETMRIQDLRLPKQNSAQELFYAIHNYAQKNVFEFANENNSHVIPDQWNLFVEGVNFPLNAENAKLHLADFATLTPSEKRKIKTFKIQATKNGWNLEGEKKFKVNHDADFDPNKIVDLYGVNWKQQEYNYQGGKNSETGEEFPPITFEQFKQNHVKELIQKQLDAQTQLIGKTAKLKEDYELTTFVSGEGSGEFDIDTPEAKAKIEEFLSTSYAKISIRVQAHNLTSNVLQNWTIQRYYNNPLATPAPEKPIPDVSIPISRFLNVKDLGKMTLKNQQNNPELEPEEIWSQNNLTLWQKIIELQKKSNAILWANEPEIVEQRNKFLDELKLSDFNLSYKDAGFRPTPNPSDPNELLYRNYFSITSNSVKYYGSHDAEFITNQKVDPPIINARPHLNDLFKITDLGEIKDTDGDNTISEQEIFAKLIELNKETFNPILYPIWYFKFGWNYVNKPNGDQFDHSVNISLSQEGRKHLIGNIDVSYWTIKKDEGTKPPIDPIEPIDPEPEKPKPEKPNPEKPINKPFNKLNLLWIIPLVLIGVLLIVFAIKWISNRRGSRKIAKK